MSKRLTAMTTIGEATGLVPTPEADTEASVITKAIMGMLDAFADPQYAAAEAAEKAMGARESIILGGAKLSAKLKFDAKHFGTKGGDIVDAAVAAWRDGKNREPASLDQFKVELRRGIHPSARDYVAKAHADVAKAWKAEEGKAETPLRKMFQRQYHMWIGSRGIVQAHIDAEKPAPEGGKPDKRLATSHEEAADIEGLVANQEAAAANPVVDAKAAARKMAKAVEALMEIHAEFPLREIANFLEAVDKMDARDLSRAREKALRPKTPVTAPKPEAKPMTRAERRAAQAATPAGANAAVDNLLDE